MTLPGTPGAQVPTDALTQVVRDIEDLKRFRNEIMAFIGSQTGMTFANGQISVGAGANLVLNGGVLESANFDGNVTTPAAGTAGFGLGGASGDAVFNTLTVRNGIIGNDALTNPVSGNSYNASTTGGSVASGSYVDTASVTITVPTGFTTANILAVGNAVGSNASGGAALVHVVIGATVGDDAYNFTSAGAVGATGSLARTVTGLVGGSTIVVKTVFGGAGTGTWTSVAGRISATVTFLR